MIPVPPLPLNYRQAAVKATLSIFPAAMLPGSKGVKCMAHRLSAAGSMAVGVLANANWADKKLQVPEARKFPDTSLLSAFLSRTPLLLASCFV